MRILSNNVLITPDRNDQIALNGSMIPFMNKFEEQLGAPQSGIVVAVPEKLTFTLKEGKPGLENDTDMELQVGDKVVFNFNAVEIAKGQGMVIGKNILVRYDMIYAAIRNGEVIVINGGVIVEPCVETIKSTVIIPDTLQNKKLKTMGKVVFASKYPVRAIRSQPMLDTTSCPMANIAGELMSLDRFVRPGDVIQFPYYDATPLQHYHELFGMLSKGVLYRMQHHDVVFVSQAQEEVPC